MELIIEFIGSVGFPIAMCVMCFLYMRELEKTRSTESKANTEALSNMANAIENNTTVVTQLVNVISQYLPVIISTRNNPTNEETEGY